MPLQRLLMLSVHTSPLARLGGEKTGGMNVYIKELAQEFGRRGIAVDVFTRQSGQNEQEVDPCLGENVRVIHVPCGPNAALPPDEIFPYLSQFVAGVIAYTTRHNLRYDLIYSHYWLSGWAAYKLKDVWGIPFVQMFHTLGQMKNRIPSATQTQLPIPDTRVATEMQIVRWADEIIAATPAEQAQLLWLYRTDRRKILIAPPGVNASRFYPLPQAEAKAQLGLSPDTHLLLFVGRIEPLKGVDTILEALSRLTPSALKQTAFWVIGGDPANTTDRQLNQLKALTDQLGLKAVVSFVGAKDQNALRNYYAAASALLMPSDYESFGMVALEAMACGTPVIASQVGGLAFLVSDSESGFLIPTRDATALAERIQWILSEPDGYAQMRLEAARRAQTYTWSAIADRLLNLFTELVAKTPAIHRKR